MVDVVERLTMQMIRLITNENENKKEKMVGVSTMHLAYLEKQKSMIRS